MVLYHPDMIYVNFYVPESGFLSGSPVFQKVHIWNLCTCYGEFRDAKIFPDQFCPGSGFALNRSFFDVFLNLSLYSSKMIRI